MLIPTCKEHRSQRATECADCTAPAVGEQMYREKSGYQSAPLVRDHATATGQIRGYIIFALVQFEKNYTFYSNFYLLDY